jgi:Glycoside Hydrolase Family 113
VLVSLCLVALLGLVLPDAPSVASPAAIRHIAIVLPRGWPAERFERWSAFALREGIEMRVVGEGEPKAAGWEAVRFAAPPVSESFRRLLAEFPVTLEAAGFVFDDRPYRASGDAVVLTHPDRPGETLVLGNSRDAAIRIARWIFRISPGALGRFRALSGELTKEGRFRRGRGGLEIDRASDRDRIAERERFFGSLETERRGVAVWRFQESERRAYERWAPVLDRILLPATSRRAVTVFLYPDPSRKGLFMGSSRPADLSWGKDGARVDVDASVPLEPDLVTPVLASAAIGARHPRLRDRPALLLAAGARVRGRWWGRDVASFAAFLESAQVQPTVEDVLSAEERDDVSPICIVGAAAAWLDAGVREGGAAALERAFAADEGELAATLARWRTSAQRVPVSAPRRRALPAGFLRGVSYAMSNSIEDSYASPRSLETLKRLSTMSVNSIAVIPYAYSRTERTPELAFVHRSPRGETDEGSVRAVIDARSLRMTAMLKPQLWIGGDAFVGTVAMGSPDDWAKWFRAYRRFAVHHAIVAEASGAALFCVGTELSGTETREREWRETIAAVRRATGAALVYTTNWASGAPRVRFWDALDAIGVDFYDPLSGDRAASDAALAAGARRAAEPVARLSAATGKPVLFAEAGYPPAPAAWTAPHDDGSAGPLAPADAARAIRAVFAGLGREKWWRGVYWWKAFSDGRDAGASDRGFNFLGRPAGDAIAAGFRSLAAAEGGSR